MHPYDRMIAFHGVSPHEMAIARCSLRLRESTVLCAQTLEENLQRFGKSVVGGSLRCPACVSASLWNFDESEYGEGRSLVLVRDVRVVSGGSQFAGAPAEAVQIVFSKIDGMELDVVFDMCTYGLDQGQLSILPHRTHWLAHVDVQAAEILPKLLLPIRANVFEVLVPEDDHTSLRDQ